MGLEENPVVDAISTIETHVDPETGAVETTAEDVTEFADGTVITEERTHEVEPGDPPESEPETWQETSQPPAQLDLQPLMTQLETLSSAVMSLQTEVAELKSQPSNSSNQPEKKRREKRQSAKRKRLAAKQSP